MTTYHDGLGCEWIELDHPDGWQSKQKTILQAAELSARGQARNAGMKAPLEDKLNFAIRCIDRTFTKPVKWYLSYSGGNDSTVLSYICVELLQWNIPHIMSNTRLEYPETMRNVRTWKQWLAERDTELFIARPTKLPYEVWQRHGLPLFSKELASKYRQWFETGNDKHLRTVPAPLIPVFHELRNAGIKVSEKCCDEMKKKPLKTLAATLGLQGTITGSRAQESNARRLAYLQRGALYFSNRNNQWICNPLVHWSHDDIAEFQRQHGIKLEQIDTATGRSGCRACGFGCLLEQHAGRETSFQALHRSCPKLWETVMYQWGFGQACMIANINTISETNP